MGKLVRNTNVKRVLSVLGLAMLFVMCFVLPAMAANLPGNVTVNSAVNVEMTEIQGLVQKLITALFGFAVIIAVVNVVWQGFKLMSGNPSAAQGAKDAIIKTIIGLGVILFAWAIVGVAVNIFASLGK